MEADVSEHDLDVVAQMSSSHRAFVLPILLALDELGGSSKPKQCVDLTFQKVGHLLNEKQVAHLRKNNRLGWTRFGMVKAGLLGGPPGTWEVTEVGQRYLEAHREDEIEVPSMVPELGDTLKRQDKGAKETVPATTQAAYHVPLLRLLKAGVTDKSKLLAQLYEVVDRDLLPGDRSMMPNGSKVWNYRASWGLNDLRDTGAAKSLGRARWAITQTGRERLEQEGADWSLSSYATGRARVRVKTPGKGHGKAIERPEAMTAWSSRAWRAARAELGSEVFDTLDMRLRPELGPSPAAAPQRNVIFYGPPGTGKTYLAKIVARALADRDVDDPEGRSRLVQFHPSYAYEDFVQGLRPDLEDAGLRYALHRGPFRQLCDTAAEDPDHFYALVIDEINRGDPARIFGELLYALEYRGEPVDLALGGQLIVPPNLVIIGTMNSVDRSVALVDYALRRRFAFVRVDPNPELISDLRGSEAGAELAAGVLLLFNEWLVGELGVEHQLGHSYFLNETLPLDGRPALEAIWRGDVRPLLEEYFFGDATSLQRAREVWQKAIVTAAAEVDASNSRDDLDT